MNSLFALLDGTGVLITCCLSVPMSSGKLPLAGFKDVGLISYFTVCSLGPGVKHPAYSEGFSSVQGSVFSLSCNVGRGGEGVRMKALPKS